MALNLKFKSLFKTNCPEDPGWVILKALHALADREQACLLFGDPEYFEGLGRDLGIPLSERLEFFTVGRYPYPPRWGEVDKSSGEFALRSLQAAVQYCSDERLPLLVTGPINKKAIQLAAGVPMSSDRFRTSSSSTNSLEWRA